MHHHRSDLILFSLLIIIIAVLAATTSACTGVCYVHTEDQINECCQLTIDYEGIGTFDGVTVCMPNGGPKYNCTDLSLINDVGVGATADSNSDNNGGVVGDEADATGINGDSDVNSSSSSSSFSPLSSTMTMCSAVALAAASSLIN